MNGRRSGGHVTFTWLKDHVIIVCLFVCLFVCYGVFRPTREIFTHIESLPMLVRGCKF